MAALWTPYTIAVAAWYDAPIEKTEEETAKFLANAYRIAVAPTMISLVPGSTIVSKPPIKPMEDAILDTINQMKNGEGKPTVPMFTGWATEIVNYWSAVVWNPLPPPPGYVSPTAGHSVISGGTPSPLDSSLWNAFNNEPLSTPMGIIIANKLVTAFKGHFLTVSGVYNGLIPAAPSPVPGPPFPWVGLV